MTASNIYALAQAGHTAKGNPAALTLQTLRRRARAEGIRARWTAAGFNRNGQSEYVLIDANNSFIGTATNDDDLHEWLVQLLGGANHA